MTTRHPMCPQPRGLQLVSINHTPASHTPAAAGNDRAVAAACMARLARVRAVLDYRLESFDSIAAERAQAFFAEIAAGVRDPSDGVAAPLDFLRTHPMFVDFVLYGDVDVLIRAAAAPATAGIAASSPQLAH